MGYDARSGMFFHEESLRAGVLNEHVPIPAGKPWREPGTKKVLHVCIRNVTTKPTHLDKGKKGEMKSIYIPLEI